VLSRYDEIAKDAKGAEERQTTRISMNAPPLYAQRLRKPAEHYCSLLAFFGAWAVQSSVRAVGTSGQELH
jgi:hypothetical protein